MNKLMETKLDRQCRRKTGVGPRIHRIVAAVVRKLTFCLGIELEPRHLGCCELKGPGRKALFAFLAWAALALGVEGAERTLKTEANVMAEFTFTASRTYADPFNEVTLDVIFSDPKGSELRVPAFWAGSKEWKARYASPVVGTHRFRSECSDARDKGL